MKTCFIVLFLVSTAATAFAQAGPTPEMQALGAKLMQEFQSGLNCSTELIATKAELAKARAQIKELETKPEPKK